MNKRAIIILSTVIVVITQIFLMNNTIKTIPTKQITVANPNYDSSKPTGMFANQEYETKNVHDEETISAEKNKYFMLIGVTFIGGVLIAFVIDQRPN